VIALLAALTLLLGACTSSTPPASPTAAAAAATAAATPQPSSTSTPAPTPTPEPTQTVVLRALVPVTNFRAAWVETSAGEVAAVLAGTSKRYGAIEVVGEQAAEVTAALGLGPDPVDPKRLIVAPDAATVRADLAAHRDRLGFLLADDVDPSVRALGWEGTTLFGADRVSTLAEWPLWAAFTYPAGTAPAPPSLTYDPASAWTLVAGGDILLDRGVARTVKTDGKGVNFPFDGGTATITSRYCCSSFGWELPRIERTGDAGAVRALLQSADLAIANFENPAPEAFRFHASGTVFNADPALIEGLANAGIDWVSLANNHIRDAGARGITDTIGFLDQWGIAHSGAGSGTIAAHQAAILEAGGIEVALLGYDTIAPSYWTNTEDRVGSAGMTVAALTTDIAAARAAGADLVIVFPHWGVEYATKASAQQVRLGHAAIDAGADMVIGNHPHWAGAVEIYAGKPIWYALGNFVFDQTWSEPTMEGITLELTFEGTRLVQIQMRPHLILDKAQPNFMDPAGSGAVVMNQVFAASKGLLDW
jgi:poly-gamma-glutamate capsule biosynthesis protein CapA/YwtB (metallophosphatase superfamily)